MDLGLAGKVAVVTGASRGIGLAVAQTLIAEGATVVGVARSATPELEATGATVVEADLAAPDGPRAVVDAAVAAYGGVDLLVNNAGGGDAMTLQPFADLDDATWRSALDLNLMAAVRMIRAALPQLTDRQGAVVNISSIGAWVPQGPPLAYNVAKAALKAFGRGLATELGPQGVRVVTVTPGPTRTAMWDRMAEVTGMTAEQVIAGVPEQMGMVTGRIIEPEEIAATVAYLLSPRAASITGSDHLVDGGVIRTA